MNIKNNLRSSVKQLLLATLSYMLLGASSVYAYIDNQNNQEGKPSAGSYTSEIDMGQMWEAKAYLFSLSAIKNMEPNVKKRILKCIEKGNKDDMYRFITNKLGKKNAIKKLNKEIEKSKYEDLISLCSEVFFYKPKQDNSLLKWWIMEQKESKYFINKTLQFERSKYKSIYSPIKSFEFVKNNKNHIRIGLVDNFDTSVTVWKKKENKYETNVTQQKEAELFDTLLRLNKNDIYKEIRIIKRKSYSCALNAGLYKILSSKEEAKKDKFQNEEQKSKRGIFSFRVFSNQAELEEVNGPKQYDSIKIIEVRSCENRNNKFRIGIYVYQNKIAGIYVKKNHEQASHWTQVYEVHDMVTCYKVKEVDSKPFTLTTESFKSNLKIINQVNNDLIDIQNRRKVNELEKELLYLLFNKKDYNSQLVDILIKEGHIALEHIKENQSQISNLDKKIQNIVTFYEDTLSEKVTAETILSRLVEQTLMSTIANRPSSAETQALVELLKKAYKHLKKIKDKNIFILVGNTGSGKSTSANYLIGEKLIEYVNEFGEKVIEKKKKHNSKNSNQKEIMTKKNEEENRRGPKIGQKIGTSETLYARGFKVKKKKNDREKFPTLIVDCPGFGDTRTKAHMLCADISIDEAVLKSKSIKGIVLVIPIAAFLLDRGNPAFRLMQIMQGKFPDVFQVGSPEFKYVHILVTKYNQCDRRIVETFQEGKRFSKVLNEIDEEERKVRKEVEDLYQQQRIISSIQKKKEIWKLIKILHKGERIDLVDLNNKPHRKRLLRKYGNPEGCISNKKYRTALQSSQMSDVSILLKKSFFTWKSIFEAYENFPSKIEELTQKEESIKRKINLIKLKLNDFNLRAYKLNIIQRKLKEREELENEINKIEEKTNQINSEQENLNNLNQKLNDLNQNLKNSSEVTDNQQEELNREINGILSKEKVDLENSIESIKKNIEKEKIGIDKKTKEIEKIQKAIDDQQKKVNDLSNGKEEVTLWHFKSNSGDYLNINTVSNLQDKRKELHKEFRSKLEENEIVKTEKKLVDDYVGILYSDVIVKRGYRIIGRTDEETDLLNVSDNYYAPNATFTCKKCKVDFKAHYKDHKSVMFGIKKEYDGKSPYPSAQVTFLLQKEDYYSAEIEEGKSKITELNIDKARMEENLKNKKLLLKEKQKNLKKNEEILIKKKNTLQKKKNTLQVKRKKINESNKKRIQASIINVQNSIELQKNEKNREKESLEEIRSSLEKIKQNKRRYAFLILKKSDEPNFLNGLAKSLFANAEWENRVDIDNKYKVDPPEVVFQKFLKYYDEHSANLYKKCREDLDKTKILNKVGTKEKDFSFFNNDDEKCNQPGAEESDDPASESGNNFSEIDEQKSDRTLQDFLKDNKLGNFFDVINEVGSLENNLQYFLELDKDEVTEICQEANIKLGNKIKLLRIHRNEKKLLNL